MIINNNNQIWIYNLQLKLYTVVTVDYSDTVLALKASGVSNSTMSGASRFQSRTVLGKNDIFLVSIREDGIWNDLLCDFLVFRPVEISLFSSYNGKIKPISLKMSIRSTLTRRYLR